MSTRCPECEARIEQLVAQVSQLAEENANLRLLDRTLERNNAAFEALLANSSEGITLTGPERRIMRVVRGISGYRSGDLLGALIESLAVPEDQDVIVESYRSLLRRDTNQIKQRVRLLCGSGEIRYLAATVTDMLDDPNVQAIVWNYSDITAHQDG